MNNRKRKSTTGIGTFLSRIWVILLYAVGVIAQVLLLCMQENKEYEMVNLIITIVFFAIILVLFLIVFHCIGKGIRFRNDLENASNQIISMYDETRDENSTQILERLFRQRLFHTGALEDAFAAYRDDMNKMNRINPDLKIDIENYINQDLLDNEMSMSFLNQIPAAMTGMGILGTFVGLSLGLNSFNFVEAESSMTSQLQPLMDGIKVAFHTSIVGLIYSLGFNFLFRKQLSGERAAVDDFLSTYRKYVVPVTEDGSTGTFIRYQQSIVELLQEQSRNQQNQQAQVIPELQKMTNAVTSFTEETSRDQAEQLERIVNQFIEQMNISLGRSFGNLQDAINSTSEWQKKILKEMHTSMSEISRMTYDLAAVNQSMEQSVKQVSAYVEMVNTLQNTAQSNLESLNAQTDYNNKVLASERVLLSSITESSGRTTRAMSDFLNKAASQTAAIQKNSENIERLTNHIETMSKLTTEQTEAETRAITEAAQNAAALLTRTSKSAARSMTDTANANMQAITEASARTIEIIAGASSECVQKIGDAVEEEKRIIHESSSDSRRRSWQRDK